MRLAGGGGEGRTSPVTPAPHPSNSGSLGGIFHGACGMVRSIRTLLSSLNSAVWALPALCLRMSLTLYLSLSLSHICVASSAVLPCGAACERFLASDQIRLIGWMCLLANTLFWHRTLHSKSRKKVNYVLYILFSFAMCSLFLCHTLAQFQICTVYIGSCLLRILNWNGISQLTDLERST